MEHGHPARQSAHQTVMAVTADLVDPLVACISRIKSLRDHRDRWTGLLLGACALFALPAVAAQSAAPQIVAVTPRNGAEGTRVEVRGKNFQDVSAVLFAATNATFQIISPASLVAIVPHRVGTSRITVITKEGRAQSPVTFIVENDPRIPDEVSYKAGYVNPHGPPEGFTSARLWGIAIADTRAPENKSAQIEVAWTRLSCRIDGRQVVLNDDVGQLRGGLYQRHPWFTTDTHDPIPLTYDLESHTVALAVGQRSDRVWHFWSPSPRATLPAGKLEGCTAQARVKISAGALLQIGFDYWRSATIPYGTGGNNREAGASSWYFPSPVWQDATFTDIGGPQF